MVEIELQQLFARWGVSEPTLSGGRIAGRWRGVQVRASLDDASAPSRLAAAFERAEGLPDPVSVAEVHLARHASGGSERLFVPVVSRAEGLALLDLCGDSLLVIGDRATGNLTILGRDARGEPMAVEHQVLRASLHGEPARSVGGATTPIGDAPSAAARAAKLERLLPHFRCVRCAPRAPLARSGDSLTCTACGVTYPLREGVPVILPEGMLPVEPDPDAESSNSYSRQAVAFFDAFPNELVLDCGCGKPAENLPNVVHLEIVPYGNVDVVATSDALPFAADSFAAITCESVLEHVPHPWTVVNEIHRVLRPGGVLRVDTPFIAPYHAFPDHYHNFTQSGLEQLLHRFERLDGGIGPHQEPWLAVAWILRLVREGLPDDAARVRLDGSRVGELISALATGVPPSVLHPLSDEVRTAIAAGFFFYGRKPTES